MERLLAVTKTSVIQECITTLNCTLLTTDLQNKQRQAEISQKGWGSGSLSKALALEERGPKV